jgi:hypothetical protein
MNTTHVRKDAPPWMTASFQHISHVLNDLRLFWYSQLRVSLVVQGWLHCILYVLFENAMGVVKLWAVIAGQTSFLSPALGYTEDCSVITLQLPKWHGRVTAPSQPNWALCWLSGCQEYGTRGHVASLRLNPWLEHPAGLSAGDCLVVNLG